jgi:hypothetical protein
MSIANAIIQTTGTVSLLQKTNGQLINLGAADSAGTLGLTDGELDQITAGTLQIGDVNSGAITVSGAITHGNNLSLTTGAGLAFNQPVTMAVNKSLTANALGVANGTISLPNSNATLTASGTGAISLTTARDIALASGSSISVENGGLTLTAKAPGASVGSFFAIDMNGATLTTSGTGNMVLAGDSMNLGGSIVAGAQTVTLRQFSNGRAIDLGGADTVGALGITNTELNTIAAGTIQIGDGSSGAVTVSAAITQPDEFISITTPVSTTVLNGGSLNFVGSVNSALNVNGGGDVAPAVLIGNLASGSANFSAGSAFTVVIDGTTAGVNHDQFNVNGTVSLGGTTLVTTGSAILSLPGQTLTLITNDGIDPVIGTFAGIAEGGIAIVNGINFTVSYAGGDGNDGTLTQAIANIVGSDLNDTISIVRDIADPTILNVTVTNRYGTTASTYDTDNFGAFIVSGGGGYDQILIEGVNPIDFGGSALTLDAEDTRVMVSVTAVEFDFIGRNLRIASGASVISTVDDIDIAASGSVRATGSTLAVSGDSEIRVAAGGYYRFLTLGSLTTEGGDITIGNARRVTVSGAIDADDGAIDIQVSGYVTLRGDVTGASFLSTGSDFTLASGKSLTATNGDIMMTQTGSVKAGGSTMTASEAGDGDIIITAGTAYKYVTVGTVVTDGGDFSSSGAWHFTATGAINSGAGNIDINHAGSVTLRGDVTGTSFESQGAGFTLKAGQTLWATAGDIVINHTGSVDAGGTAMSAVNGGLGSISITGGPLIHFVEVGSVSTDGGAFSSAAERKFTATGDINTGVGAITLTHGDVVSLKGDVTGGSFSSTGGILTTGAGDDITVAGIIAFNHSGPMSLGGRIDAASYVMNGSGALSILGTGGIVFHVDVASPPMLALFAANGTGGVVFEAGSDLIVDATGVATPGGPHPLLSAISLVNNGYNEQRTGSAAASIGVITAGTSVLDFLIV